MDPPAAITLSDDINQSSLACEKLLQSCLLSPRLSEDDWAHGRLDDFKLWVAGINATAPGHASLEWRLRSRSDVKEVVLGLLEELMERIQDCLDHEVTKIPVAEIEEISTDETDDLAPELERRRSRSKNSSSSGTISPWSELSDEDEEGIETWPPPDIMKYAMKGAEIALAQLARLSVVIRKAGAQLRYQHADRTHEDFRPQFTELRKRMESSLWSPLRQDISERLQNLFQFRQRMEYSFAWNSLQEDISPYQKSLFQRLTSNESQKFPFLEDRGWVPFPSIPITPFQLDGWKQVEEWVLGQESEKQPNDWEEQLRRFSNQSVASADVSHRAYPYRATIHPEYSRISPDRNSFVSIYQTDPQPWPTTVMRKFLTDPARLTTVQQRLLNANVKRRNRFAFAKQNSKPTTKAFKPLAVATQQPTKTTEKSVEAPLIVAKSTPLVEAVRIKAPTVSRTALSATELGPQPLPDFKSPTPTNITKVSERGAKLRYPSRPQISGGQKTFECPYCCEVLPLIYAKEGWRSHIAQDLQPYSCVLKDCPTPEQLFGSSKDWVRHMEQSHSSDKWICYACSELPQVFESAADYEFHLSNSSIHANTFTKAQLPLLVQNGKTAITPQFENCPLCNWSERHAEFDELPGRQSDTQFKRAETIQDHVAEHLHSFALQALPDLDDDGANSLQVSTGSVEHNLKLLKQEETELQYSIEERQTEWENLNVHLWDVLRKLQPTTIRLKLFAGELRTSLLSRHLGDSWLGDSWLPTSQQMAHINMINSAIEQFSQDVITESSAGEVEGSISIMLSYLRELISDMISVKARHRWKRALSVVRFCLRIQRPTIWTMPLPKSHNVGLVENLVGDRCAFCNTIMNFFEDLDQNISSRVFEFHASVGAVKSSAILGCQLCGVFLPAINKRYLRRSPKAERYENLFLRHTLESRLQRFVKHNFTNRSLYLLFSEDEYGVKTLQLNDSATTLQVYELCCARDDYLATSRWTTAYTRLRDPLSTSSTTTIMAWQKTCSEMHPNCGNLSPRIRPTRLLEILDSGDVRLSLGDQNGTVDYCIISYIQGTVRSLTLQSESLQRFLHSIPIQEVPKTIQDAILLARALGIRYIWTDAHCVIQDSRDDQKRENNRMQSYFQNSLLNIAAAASSSSNGGLMNGMIEPVGFDFAVSSTGTGNTRHDGYCKISLRKQLPRTDDKQPLFRNAWKFSELVLSPRVLSFQSNSVVWCCNTSVSYDIGENQKSRFWQLVASIRQHLFTDDKQEKRICFDIWLAVIEHYSGLGLTVPSDKLVAISDLAEIVGRRNGLVYVAGIWREDLVRGLLWYAATEKGPNYPSRNYTAPSWSWGSLSSQVTFDLPPVDTVNSKVLAEILDYQVSNSDTNPFGAVVDGQLRIRAPFTRFENFCELSGKKTHWRPDNDIISDLEDALFLACYQVEEIPGLERWIGLVLEPLIGSFSEQKTYVRVGRVDGVLSTEVEQIKRGQSTNGMEMGTFIIE